ncbi:hypothetical protein [Sulfolobus sp. S-194]|uniref:hypothetical protein n=1 Tax=Sulfolobus sp. S-194 TaxID=2512240 RepID=UPI00143B1179|nr:hypothetical protein [Sulfolobus sp. S-194]
MFKELTQTKRLIKSYYYYPKLVLVINIAQYLYNKGHDVCIFNFDKIKWEYYPYDLNFHMKCTEKSENIIFEVEDESQIPNNFTLVTSIKKLNLGIPVSEIQKLDQNLFKINIDNKIYLFRIIDGKIVREKIKGLSEEIINLLKEYNELSLKEVVEIIYHKTKSSRDNIRKEIYFLKDIGIVEIKNGRVLLNNNSWL